MTVFVYRCPNTGQQVQARTDDPPVADDPEAYQSVKYRVLAVALGQPAYRPGA